MKPILVVGSLNMDLVISAPRLPVKGETILGSGFMMNPGGKGANQAVAVARMGYPVMLAGALGNDRFGDVMLEQLSTDDVDTSFVSRSSGASTGSAVIILFEQDNCIIVDPGSNSLMTPQRIEQLEGMISRSAMVIAQLEIPLETVEKTFWSCRKHQVATLLNPAPATDLPPEILTMTDILTPNETEAFHLSGRSSEAPGSAAQAVRDMLAMGVGQVVVTLGNRGAMFNRGHDVLHQPAYSVEVVDTTSAGDAFNGALAVCLIRGFSVEEAVRAACCAGALATTKRGALSSLPRWDEVNSFLCANGKTPQRCVDSGGA